MVFAGGVNATQRVVHRIVAAEVPDFDEPYGILDVPIVKEVEPVNCSANSSYHGVVGECALSAMCWN